MVYLPVNATGWENLTNGSLVKASFTMWYWYLGDWFFTGLFFMFQFLLMTKTKSPVLGLFTTGLVLGVAYAKQMLSPIALGIIAGYAVCLIVPILLKLIKGNE